MVERSATNLESTHSPRQHAAASLASAGSYRSSILAVLYAETAVILRSSATAAS